MSDKPVIAYLINQYPKVSHTFIRREIVALEALGMKVFRFSVRGWNDELRDASDVAEREKTRYVLQGGAPSLLLAMAKCAVANPSRFLRAFAEANRLGWRADRPLPFFWIYFAEACWLQQACRGGDIRHLHAHFGTNPATVALLTSMLGGPPFSFTVHGPEEFDKPIALKLGQKIAQAKFVAAVSSFGKSQLQRWVDYRHWNKINVVHCGLDTGAFAVEGGKVAARFVCIGRICEQKGQLLLVEACRLLRDQGIDVSLTLVGGGEMRDEVERAIKQCGLEATVSITGWVDESRVRKELLAARAMVLPSFAEGLPVAIMEAMALRRPIISTYIAGIPELVRSGEDGILVPAGDVEALTAAMREIAQAAPERISAMGESARQRVFERHDIMVEAAKLKSLMV